MDFCNKKSYDNKVYLLDKIKSLKIYLRVYVLWTNIRNVLWRHKLQTTAAILTLVNRYLTTRLG